MHKGKNIAKKIIYHLMNFPEVLVKEKIKKIEINKKKMRREIENEDSFTL